VTNSNKKVVGCKDGQGRDVALNTCLNSAAYSSAFKFTSDRVIIKEPIRACTSTHRRCRSRRCWSTSRRTRSS
jgi:hypothetical protein